MVKDTGRHRSCCWGWSWSEGPALDLRNSDEAAENMSPSATVSRTCQKNRPGEPFSRGMTTVSEHETMNSGARTRNPQPTHTGLHVQINVPSSAQMSASRAHFHVPQGTLPGMGFQDQHLS